MSVAAAEHDKYNKGRHLEVTQRKLGVAQLCKYTVSQLVALSQEISEQRQSAAAKIPKHVWQSYKNAFLSGDIGLAPDHKVQVIYHPSTSQVFESPLMYCR